VIETAGATVMEAGVEAALEVVVEAAIEAANRGTRTS